jgi:hypothetical protein
MSNQYNSKRSFSSENENSSSKKNKTPEPIELSDDETNNNDEIGELQIKRSHNRKNINKDWFSTYTWLESEEKNQEMLIFCKLCRNANRTSKFSKGTNVFRIDKIKQHLNTNEHKESELMLLNSNQNESNRDNTEQSDEKKTIISLIMSNYFSSKHNISLNVYSDLCKLVSLQTRNNVSDKISTLKPASLEKLSKPKSKYGSHKNPIAACDFLDSIASVIKNSLFEELNSSPYWSVMIDEANSIDGNKHLAIVGKYITNNMPIMRYLGLINLESTDSENIYNKIKLFCISNEISYQNVIHFGSDGASNMTGYKSGVAARFKKMNPFISSNHCISHRLHLAGKDASDEVIYFQKYEKTLRELYGYFSRSHKRQNILKLMQVINYLNICFINFILLTGFYSLLGNQ